jgi:hypothetical protein
MAMPRKRGLRWGARNRRLPSRESSQAIDAHPLEVEKVIYSSNLIHPASS